MRTKQRGKIPVLQNTVIVFSKNYLPMSRVNIKRAVTLLVTQYCSVKPYAVL
jgi:hypothetical protein